jgi:hypothetical protein
MASQLKQDEALRHPDFCNVSLLRLVAPSRFNGLSPRLKMNRLSGATCCLEGGVPSAAQSHSQLLNDNGNEGHACKLVFFGIFPGFFCAT